MDVKRWTANQWLGAIVALTSGPSSGMIGTVTGNTVTTLSVSGLTNVLGSGYIVCFGTLAGVSADSASTSILIQNCVTDANVAALFLKSVAASATVISNGVTQTWAARGGTYTLPNPMGHTPDPITPDPLGNGRECFITVTRSVAVAAPSSPAAGRRLTLVFTLSLASLALTFAGECRIVQPLPGVAGQAWACDLVCDGVNWIQTNPSSTWVDT